jgi:uncharacterized iron-regulated protein
MEYSFKTLLLCCALVLSACHSTAPVTTGTSSAVAEKATIRDAATGQTLTPDQLIARLATAPMVIVGEEHTNAEHHRIETWLLQNLSAKRQQGSVLLEMIDISQQDAVNRVKEATRSGAAVSSNRAAQALRWNPGWPWDLYGDLVMAALEGPYPLLAANISRQQVKALYANPTFPPGERSSRPKVHESLSAIIYLMHDGQIGDEQIRAMMSIQQHRDRFMAEQLRKAPHPALLIAGGYHAAKDIGVPLHLADLQAQAPVVVMLTTDGTTVSAKQADFVWSVPVAR